MHPLQRLFAPGAAHDAGGSGWFVPAVHRKADVAFFGMYRVMLPAYGAGPYLPAIVLERPVYVREMADGLYSPLAYLLYKVKPAPMLNQVLPGYTQELVALKNVGYYQCYSGSMPQSWLRCR